MYALLKLLLIEGVSDVYLLRWFAVRLHFQESKTRWTNWTKFGAFWAHRMKIYGKDLHIYRITKQVMFVICCCLRSHFSCDIFLAKFVSHKPHPLKRSFPRLSSIPYCEELASLCLKLQPNHRISAKEALRHHYFLDLPPKVFNLSDSKKW